MNAGDYRAPEVIHGPGSSFPSDMWSIGCMLVEFFTGHVLFPARNDSEHLAMIKKVCTGFDHDLDGMIDDGTSAADTT
jgi:serine/threonine protein kinase